MKRTSTEPPYLSWYLMVRNSEKTIEACLKSIRERTPEAEIVVVDTCSSDSTPEIAKRYADVFEVYRGPRGDWDEEMPWFDDAAAARQRGLELCSGTWRCWIDDDDVLPGPEEAARLLKLNAQFCPGKVYEQIEGDDKAEPVGLEDLLREIEEKHPEVTMLRCPYLYERDEHDQALVFQWRERFIRWSDPPKFVWAEKSHDVLVPIGDYRPPRGDLAHLLFVHNREFSGESVTYSHSRHFDVMSRQYDEGDRSTRRCLYLAAYSTVHCPHRRMEFLNEAMKLAVTDADRCRVHIDIGNYYREMGLSRDALANYGAAIALCPQMPDPHLAAGEWAFEARDWSRAIVYLQQALDCEVDGASQVNPRHHRIRYPTLLAEALKEAGGLMIEHGLHQRAVELFARGADVMQKVHDDSAIGADKTEAFVRGLRLHHAKQSQEMALAIDGLATFLLANDEPEKLEQLLAAVPHNLADHPIVMAIEDKFRHIAEHKHDWGVYVDEYNDNQRTGYVHSPDAWLDPEATPIKRVAWLSMWLKEHAPNARVLDVGCCDGLIGIPLMLTNPGITYTGIDINASAIVRFHELLDQDRFAHLAERVERLESVSAGEFADMADGDYDVILWTEIIEHVQDPVEDLHVLQRLLKDEGTILCSTPWGAFDAGHPPEKTYQNTPRGHVGHLRALMPRDVARIMANSHLRLTELTRIGADHRLGNEMVMAAERETRTDSRPVAFSVPGALWDWHGRSLRQEGMGASEETIAYLAERLASERPTEVYGPVPREDVHRGVAYWKREQIRHLWRGRPDAKIVVSRNPQYAETLDDMIGHELRKILWLQDAYYPGLNEEIANRYEEIVVVSEWHKEAMHQIHGVPLDKMIVAYNFLLAEHFEGEAPERKHDRFIYASSPDRGLIKLLRLWPRIRASYPEAELEVYYGWRGCIQLGSGRDESWVARFTEIRKQYEELRYQDGVKDVGMVNHEQLARAMRAAGVWCYPTDFTETGCLTACKAKAAGMVPVTTALAALTETAASNWSTLVAPDADDYDDQILDGIDAAMEIADEERAFMSKQAIETYRVENAALPIWRELLD